MWNGESESFPVFVAITYRYNGLTFASSSFFILCINIFIKLYKRTYHEHITACAEREGRKIAFREGGVKILTGLPHEIIYLQMELSEWREEKKVLAFEFDLLLLY